MRFWILAGLLATFNIDYASGAVIDTRKASLSQESCFAEVVGIFDPKGYYSVSASCSTYLNSIHATLPALAADCHVPSAEYSQLCTKFFPGIKKTGVKTTAMPSTTAVPITSTITSTIIITISTASIDTTATSLPSVVSGTENPPASATPTSTSSAILPTSSSPSKPSTTLQLSMSLSGTCGAVSTTLSSASSISGVMYSGSSTTLAISASPTTGPADPCASFYLKSNDTSVVYADGTIGNYLTQWVYRTLAPYSFIDGTLSGNADGDHYLASIFTLDGGLLSIVSSGNSVPGNGYGYQFSSYNYNNSLVYAANLTDGILLPIAPNAAAPDGLAFLTCSLSQPPNAGMLSCVANGRGTVFYETTTDPALTYYGSGVYGAVAIGDLATAGAAAGPIVTFEAMPICGLPARVYDLNQCVYPVTDPNYACRPTGLQTCSSSTCSATTTATTISTPISSTTA